MGKSENMFESLMKITDKLSDTVYKATTAKRKTVVVPAGITVYDTDEKTFYGGDGVTYGGVSSTRKSVIRQVPIHAPENASGGTAGLVSGNATLHKLYWSGVGRHLRTGDGILISSGSAGVLPSGITPASGGTFYVVKDKDDLFSDLFKITTTQSGAFSGTPATVNISGSGTSGWVVSISTLQIGEFEDILYLTPVSGSVSVLLPYAGTVVTGLVSGNTAVGTSDGRKITIKRSPNPTNTGVVTVQGANASGLSGVLTCDGLASGVPLTSGAAGAAIGYTFVSDTTNNQYFTVAESNGVL